MAGTRTQARDPDIESLTVRDRGGAL